MKFVAQMAEKASPQRHRGHRGGTEKKIKIFKKPLWSLCVLCASVVSFYLITACTPLSNATPTQEPTALPRAAPTAPTVPTPSAVPTLTASPVPSATTAPSATPSIVPSQTADTRLPPDQWQDWPIIPAVSARAKAIYEKGVAAGNDPHRFSKVGDCQNITSFFLGAFDHSNQYVLGDKYNYLQPTIDYFAGSWGRDSQSVRGGFNVAAVLLPYNFQPDNKVCIPSETPLACELRLNKPSIALISMETWWAGKKASDYEKYLRQIVDYAISQNVLPILATKADNLEGDNSINAAIARVAYDYDLPLWNWWRAAQLLPNHGLTSDGFHLTNDVPNAADPLLYRRLSDPMAETLAWPQRNITALEVLDAVRKDLQ